MVTDGATGRGIMNMPPVVGGTPMNLNFVFYLVNAGKVFAMEMDAVTPLTPLLNGAVLQQQTPILGFSNASLNGGMVIYLTGRSQSGCGGGTAPAPNVLAGLLTPDGIGTVSLTYDQNCGGAPTSVTGLPGTYSVTSNGRAAFRLGGAYVTTPATLGVAIFSGEFTADGAIPTGNIIGTEDTGAASGPTLGATVNATYSISSSPTNGRGTIAGSIGGNGIIYGISASKFVVVSLSDPNPAVLIFEQ